MNREEMLKKAVVYQIPGMEKAKVTYDVVYKVAGDVQLTMDLYYPADYQKDKPLPAVIFIHGDASWEILKTIKSGGQYTSWGQLAAASGLIGITFTHRSTGGFQDLTAPTEDILDLFAYVQQHASELGVASEQIVAWVCSAGGPTGLTALMKQKPSWVKGIVSYYAIMDLYGLKEHLPDAVDDFFSEFSASTYLSIDPAKVPPMLIVKAMLDRPFLNESIDRFTVEAGRVGIPFQLVTHPEGQHSFDLLDDNDTSHAIIQETLTFCKKQLQNE